MLISVITPVLNGAATIGRTIESIAASTVPYEHIIQDGGSTDSTSVVVREHATSAALRWFQEPDSGIYDAVAKGMAKAEGDILAWLGADDYYLPWTLSTVARVFARNPDVAWIIGLPALGFPGGVVKVAPLAPVYLRSNIRRGWHRAGQLGFLQQEAMFWRRSLWEQACGAETIRRYRYAGDYHLWKAFAGLADLRTVSSVFAVFSSSATQVSARMRGAYCEEAGCPSNSMEAAPWGKVLNRGVSVLCNRRVIRPEEGLA